MCVCARGCVCVCVSVCVSAPLEAVCAWECACVRDRACLCAVDGRRGMASKKTKTRSDVGNQ